MTTLEAPPEAAPPAGEPAAPEAEVRTCHSCGAAMAPEQDWCLECGTAAPGRLGAKPGWRPAMTIVGATLVLILGAVAASYAALAGDAQRDAGRPSVIASVPATPPPGAGTTTFTPAPSDALPTTPTGELPTVTSPDTKSVPESDDPEPIVPGPSSGSSSSPGSVTPTPSPSTGSSSSPSSPGDPAGDDTTEDEPAEPEAIDLPADAGALYDPYGNAAARGEPARALDGNPSTSWFVQAPDGADTMAVGYIIDLEDPAAVGKLVLRTKTPGFRVEVYGTTSAKLPPDVLDDRWIHLRDRADVDAAVGGVPKDGNENGDGEELIGLGDNAEGKKLRHVLLWFTLPPENGLTIRLTDLELRP